MNRKGIASVGWRFACMGVLCFVVQLVMGLCFLAFASPELQQKEGVVFSFLTVIVSMDLVAFPFIYLLCRKLPKGEIVNQKLGAGKFFMGITFCAAFCVVGGIVGAVVNLLFNFLGSGEASADTSLAELMLNSSFGWRVMTVGILAPIFEELIFRKVLIDHLSKYGKTLAVIASGLMFGLYHGNFAQFFFATMLGMFFGHVYVTTGRIRYSIMYHMIVNCSTSIVTMALVSRYTDIIGGLDVASVMRIDAETMKQLLPITLLIFAWFGLILIIAITGIVLFFVNLKKMHVNDFEGAPKIGESLKLIFSNWGMWLFFAICIFLFVNSYLQIL